jgi:hypothetical protein
VLDAGQIALVAWNKYMHEVRSRADDVSCAWDAVLRVICEAEERVFASEGQTSEHPRWADLSDRPIRFHGGLGYVTWKAENDGRGILELTGKLRGQLTGLTAGHLWRAPQHLEFGSDYETFSGVPGRPRSPLDRTAGNDIGGMHAEGRKNYYPMPERMPMRLVKRNVNDIADRMMDWVLSGEVPS